MTDFFPRNEKPPWRCRWFGHPRYVLIAENEWACRRCGRLLPLEELDRPWGM